MSDERMNKGLVLGVMRSRQPDWLAERYWPRVDRSGSCWLWLGPLQSGGYGQIHLAKDGGKNVTWSTHRLGWLVAGGFLDYGKELDHLCRVRACCNPDHLESVTHQVNMTRASEAQTHCIHGHEYTSENTLWYGKAKTRRMCRTCSLKAMKEWRARRKAASK